MIPENQTDKSICVMPERIKSDYNLNICTGIYRL